MEDLTPTTSLKFFKENPPELFSGDVELSTLIENLITALEQEESEYYHTNILKKGKDLIKHIIGKCIDYLSDKSNSPKIRSIERIVKYIDDFSIFEEMLFGLNPQYRDHTLHSLWVYLFGHQWIIKMGGYDKIRLSGQLHILYFYGGIKKFIASSEPITSDKPHFEAMWVMISILHDLGYPVEAITNKPNEVFGNILEPFGIDFNSIFLHDFLSRINFLHQSVCDIISKCYRPRELSKEEVDGYIAQADAKEAEGITLPIPIPIQEPSLFKDESLEMEFRIATVEKNHSAWSALFSFKNISYLHESDYRIDMTLNYLKLLSRKDILYSILHHTSEEPKDIAVNRFQFILLFMDDIEELARYGKGGKERGVKSNYCDVQFDANAHKMSVKLDYTRYDSTAEEKFDKFSQKYKAQKYYEIDEGKYKIDIHFIDHDYSETLSLTLMKDI